MKKFSAMSMLEVSLIFVLVAFVSYYGWQALTNKSFSLLKFSTITSSTSGPISKVLSELTLKIDALISYLNSNKGKENSSEYISKRIETTGAIGQLIAAFNSAKEAGSDSLNEIQKAALDALKNLILSDKGLSDKTASSEQIASANDAAKACLANPSSCTTLMTITSTSATLSGVGYSDVYNGGNIPVDFSYTYSYVDDSGNVKTRTVTQSVFIQNGQNTANIGKPYSSFLSGYIDSIYNSNLVSGGAGAVQNLMDNYTSGSNPVLTSNVGQYYDFATHTMYQCKNAYSGGSCG